MNVRTIEHEGTWWAERPDGTWARWSHVFGEWEPADRPPRGPFAASGSDVPTSAPLLSRPREMPSVALPEKGWLLDYLGTLLRLTLPGLLLGLALPLAFLLSLSFLFLSEGGLLPPPDNAKAILIWSGVAGAFVAGAIVALRHLPPHYRSGRTARRALAAALVTAGVFLAWLATGSQWSGSAASKGATLGAVLLLGIGIDVLHRRGMLAWSRPVRGARRSLFTGPG